MERERISVDDLLARQGKIRPGIRATLKPASDDRVTITPVVAAGACGCSLKITVNKADIEAVTPTDDVSDCCGERLIVVEVAFANETVGSIFRQLGEAAENSFRNLPLQRLQRGRPNGPLPGPRDFENLIRCCQSCELFAHSPFDRDWCYERCSQYHGH